MNNKEETETILKENKNRFVLFPVEHHDIWDLYKKSLGSFWTVEEIDFSQDINDWENKLTDKERYFIKNILAFFASSDGIVNENLALKFYNEIQVPEIRQLYATQIQIEAIHSECVTGETMLLTDKGYFPIQDLDMQSVSVWNGDRFSNTLIEKTGVKKILKVELTNGNTLRCSEKHKWFVNGGEIKYAIDLKHGDSVDVPNDHPVIDSNINFKKAREHGKFSCDYHYSENMTLFDRTMKRLKGWWFFDFLPSSDKKKLYVPLVESIVCKVEWLNGVLSSKNAEYKIGHNNEVKIIITHEDTGFIKKIQLLCTSLGFIPRMDIIGDTIGVLYFDNRCVSSFQKYANSDTGLLPDIISISKETMEIKKITEEPEEKTYCFHEPLKGKGTFNGIVTGQCYSLMIDTYIKNLEEKNKIFKSMENNPIVKKKAEWALKWINDDTSFAERLLAFGAVEGIFFSGSFCAIFWLKSRELMPGLAMSNQFISRDESLHCQTCVLIYSKLKNKLPEERVHELFREAYEIEEEFITESLPATLIGMNPVEMKQYIQYITDYWLEQLGYSKMFNVKNPFKFMAYLSLENKTNFFEKRVSEYSKANVGRSRDTMDFKIDDDF